METPPPKRRGRPPGKKSTSADTTSPATHDKDDQSTASKPGGGKTTPSGITRPMRSIGTPATHTAPVMSSKHASNSTPKGANDSKSQTSTGKKRGRPSLADKLKLITSEVEGEDAEGKGVLRSPAIAKCINRRTVKTPSVENDETEKNKTVSCPVKCTDRKNSNDMSLNKEIISPAEPPTPTDIVATPKGRGRGRPKKSSVRSLKSSECTINSPAIVNAGIPTKPGGRSSRRSVAELPVESTPKRGAAKVQINLSVTSFEDVDVESELKTKDMQHEKPLDIEVPIVTYKRGPGRPRKSDTLPTKTDRQKSVTRNNNDKDKPKEDANVVHKSQSKDAVSEGNTKKIPKKRGRPRKSDISQQPAADNENLAAIEDSSHDNEQVEEKEDTPVVRKRGRPPKSILSNESG